MYLIIMRQQQPLPARSTSPTGRLATVAKMVQDSTSYICPVCLLQPPSRAPPPSR